MSSHLNYQLRLKLRHPYDPYLGGTTPLLTILLLGLANSAYGGGSHNGGTGSRPEPAAPAPPARATPEPTQFAIDNPPPPEPPAPARFTPERAEIPEPTEPTQTAIPNPPPPEPLAPARATPERAEIPEPTGPTQTAIANPPPPEPPPPARSAPERTERTQPAIPNPQPPQAQPMSDLSARVHDSPQAQQSIAPAPKMMQYVASRTPNIPLSQTESLDQVPTSINLRVTGILTPGPTGAGRKIGVLEITDDGRGTSTPSLTHGNYFFNFVHNNGERLYISQIATPSKQIFEFRQNAEGVWELWLKAGLTMPADQTGFIISYRVTSTGEGTQNYDSAAKIEFSDHVPTNINLRLTVSTLDSGPTGAGRKIGVLEITDDGLGTNIPSIINTNIPNLVQTHYFSNFRKNAEGIWVAQTIIRSPKEIVEFRQNAEGVWELWLRAGETIPTDQTDFTIIYRVTSTGEGTQNYYSTATITIIVTVNIYENHPLTKPIYDTSGDGTFTLTENYEDNALFRITADGRIWWRAVPDYENPQDGTAGDTGLNARDNIYQIEVTHTASGGAVTKTHLAVQVEDIAREVDFSTTASKKETRLPHATLTIHNLDYFNYIQSAQTPYLLWGTFWAVPDTGPLIITWSLSGSPLNPIDDRRSVPPDVVSTLTTQAESEAARAKVEAALAEFEAVTNIKFIEVARDDSKRPSDFKFIFQNDKTSIYFYYGLANYPGPSETNIWLSASSVAGVPVSVLLHEIGHALGLKHPASARTGWPSDPNLNSIMNGVDSGQRLQTADIEALQFLYGAPGTPEHHLLSRVSKPLQTDGLQNWIHFFNVNENIDTDTVILTPTTLKIAWPKGFGVTYSLPAGRFDNDLFTINRDDFGIRFKRSPDYENPQDGEEAPYARNNIYELLLLRGIPPIYQHFSDDYHAIVIEVIDVDETIDTSTQLDII